MHQQFLYIYIWYYVNITVLIYIAGAFKYQATNTISRKNTMNFQQKEFLRILVTSILYDFYFLREVTGGLGGASPHGAIVTNSSAAVGWIATQLSKSAFVAPICNKNIIYIYAYVCLCVIYPVWACIWLNKLSWISENEKQNSCFAAKTTLLAFWLQSKIIK